jgi:hypothetical protein
MSPMRELDDLFAALSRSKFRAKFKLRGRELQMVRTKGIDAIMTHASKIITGRLAPAIIPNDGKQTPWRNHPVFVAQHATATCCRGCLEKWHRIPRGHELDANEMEHVLAVIRRWLSSQCSQDTTERVTSVAPSTPEKQLNLFETEHEHHQK